MPVIRSLKFATILLLCQSLIVLPVAHADQLSLPSGDLIVPEVIHKPDTSNVRSGDSKAIRATVTDNVGIKSVTLFYRPIGAKNYVRLEMKPVAGSDDYEAVVSDIESPGIEYYIQATDLAGNTLLNGYEFSPLVISATEAKGGNDAAVGENTADSKPAAASSSFDKKWLWIGLGVLAAGAALAASGGGDGSGGGDPAAKPDSSSVTVTAPVPGN